MAQGLSLSGWNAQHSLREEHLLFCFECLVSGHTNTRENGSPRLATSSILRPTGICASGPPSRSIKVPSDDGMWVGFYDGTYDESSIGQNVLWSRQLLVLLVTNAPPSIQVPRIYHLIALHCTGSCRAGNPWSGTQEGSAGVLLGRGCRTEDEGSREWVIYVGSAKWLMCRGLSRNAEGGRPTRVGRVVSKEGAYAVRWPSRTKVVRPCDETQDRQ